MTLVITDLFMINYAPIQPLKNTSQILLSWSRKFDTYLKSGSRVKSTELATGPFSNGNY